MVIMLKDIFIVIVNDEGLDDVLIVFGYVGWIVGQLEKEMQENVWFIIEVDEEIFFNMFMYKKWQVIVNKFGVDVW